MIKIEKSTEYFAAQVADAATALKMALPPFSQLYISELLADFVTKGVTEPVFYDFAKAVNSPSSMRIRYYKDLGDKSMMIAGVWPGSLVKKPVKIGYYVSMGQMGYGNLAAIFRTKICDEHFAELFADLEANFDLYRCIVGKASGLCSPYNVVGSL